MSWAYDTVDTDLDIRRFISLWNQRGKLLQREVSDKQKLATADVREWGVRGDGLTDASPGIKRAMSDLSASGGGELYVPTGTYMLQPGTTVTVGGNNYHAAIVPPSNVSFRGAGKTASIFKAAPGFSIDGAMMMVNGQSGVTVRDLGFDGNIANQTLVTSSDNGYSAVVCHNNCADIDVISSAFTGFTKDCISAGYPNGTTVDRLNIWGCKFSDWQRGAVTLVSAKKAHVGFCDFLDATRGLGSVAQGSAALWTEPNANTDPIDVTFALNHLSNLNIAIWLYNAQQTDSFQATVALNDLYDCDTGLYALSAWHAKLVNNTLRSCGQSATSAYNLPTKLIGARWAEVMNNTYRDCGSNIADIEITGASHFSVIDNNNHINSKRGWVHSEMSGTQFGNPRIRREHGESGGIESPGTYTGIRYKCPIGTPGEDGELANCTVPTSTTTGLGTAFATEYWQGGSMGGNSAPGSTGIAHTIVGPYAPGYGSVVWNPGNIASGSQDSVTLTVPGANTSVDPSAYDVFAPYTLAGLHVSAYCSAVNTVTIVLLNLSGIPVDLVSGTWSVKLRRRY